MKLLNSKDVENKKKVNQNLEIYKGIQSKKNLEREILELRLYKDSIEPYKIKAVKDFSEFMMEMQKKKALIISEIQELEDYKKGLIEQIIN